MLVLINMKYFFKFLSKEFNQVVIIVVDSINEVKLYLNIRYVNLLKSIYLLFLPKFYYK